MRFKDYIKESIIDIPRRTYAPGVFDNADTSDPKIKDSVKDLINNQIKEFESEYPVLKKSLIGSILTKRYRNDADLDINILFDVPKEKQEEERLRLSKKYLSSASPDSVQGKEIPGTKHPINYYFITDKQTYDDQNEKADAVFDIDTNKFIKRPEDFEFDMNLYLKDFERKVQEIDVVKGELKRDIIDYDELKELNPNDILNLQEKIKDKLDEIEDSLEQIKKIGDTVDAERRAAFDTDMSPDEIRQFGIKNRLPKNVIYKLLEKYHYIKFYKKCKDILKDGEVTDAEIDSLKTEAKGKSVAFTFGRFNPPTIGHEKLINKVASLPTNDYKIYLSRSEDNKKNPLSPAKKLAYMKSMFPKHASNILLNPTNMVLDLATELHNKGYTDVTMVAGSDRVREFEGILKKYNDVKSRHGYYNFDSINVVSAGERDPDAEGATGMSASKMRDAASKGDIKSFSKGVPSGFRQIDSLMKDVRQGMNLAASYGGLIHVSGAKPIATLEEFEQQQIRDLYIREMIFNIGDTVDYVKEDVQGKVVRRSTNYIVLEDNNNNLHKAWIWDCIPVAADREIEVREFNLDVDYGFEAVSSIDEKKDDGHTRKLPQDKQVGPDKKGTQPKKYYKDLKKSTKQARADFFKKQDTTKPGYKPAPGDEKAKTKPSVHTQKYKKMFGELKKELSDACWKGYKQVGMKNKNGKQVPNCVPEAYDIGHDYAKHTTSITPGQDGYDPKYSGGSYVPSKEEDNKKQVVTRPMTTDVNKKDIEEWALSDAVIDKYKERYKEEWRTKLDEVVKTMMEKL